jgi:hypothetical protein
MKFATSAMNLFLLYRWIAFPSSPVGGTGGMASLKFGIDFGPLLMYFATCFNAEFSAESQNHETHFYYANFTFTFSRKVHSTSRHG